MFPQLPPFNMSIIAIFLFCLVLSGFVQPLDVQAQTNISPFWSVQSIDTMKYSRDVAREKLTDSGFDLTIDTQVKNIAATGATHVSIATPYDDEFIPILFRWVSAARKYQLKVWFRGNFSGWEGWFGYSKITREDHLAKTRRFITQNYDLFRSGDIFTPCPECENGGPGDPRMTGDVSGFREFMITQYQLTQELFTQKKLQIITNYASMNGDVAGLIMDKPTTEAMGGIVVVDHYVATVDKLITDLKRYAEKSGGQVVLGEFGVPIPDIHGRMTADQQAEWLDEALLRLTQTPEVVGLNYWANIGSSTALWTGDNQPLPAALVLARYYSPRQIKISLKDELDRPIKDIFAFYGSRQFLSDSKGVILLPYNPAVDQVKFSSPKFQSRGLSLGSNPENMTITLIPQQTNWWYDLRKLTHSLLRAILRIS